LHPSVASIDLGFLETQLKARPECEKCSVLTFRDAAKVQRNGTTDRYRAAPGDV